jgi:hypothetical protein
VKAEFHHRDEPDVVLAVATWSDPEVTIESEDPVLAESLRRAFRRVPVVVDDGSYRTQGTHGEVVVQPGDLEWFRAAAQVRASTETGLVSRLVPGITEGGYDPAAGYRTFGDSVERLSS